MSIYAFYENCICLLPCFISFVFMVSLICSLLHADCSIIWAAPSEFGTYRLCEQRRFRRACASAQSRQNLRCSLIHALSQEEPSDRKLDPWPLWMVGHAQLKFVMTECSKTQIRLTGLIWSTTEYDLIFIICHLSFGCFTYMKTRQSLFVLVQILADSKP